MTQGLVANLAVALIAALLGAILALRLRQSAVIGYIAAGIAIGPFTPGLVLDPHAVEEVADLGLGFLLIPTGLKGFPALFEWLAGLRKRELFVLAVAAVALGTAYVSTLFGVSLALGAFVAGLAVGESDLSHQVLAEIVPLRDVLAGLFFV